MNAGRVHFAGIGGIGMSAIAQVFLQRGWQVSGCDVKESALIQRLREEGMHIWIGHSASHVDDSDLLVYTAALPDDHPEIVRAREKGIRVIRRSQALGMLLEGHTSIAVTGTHGKTTTTGMIASILEAAGADPQVLIGGEMRRYGGNVRLGRGDYVVVEACEAYDSFLDLTPTVAVITNVEAEHLDYFRTEARMMESYRRFVQQVQPGGFVVAWADDARSLTVCEHAPVKVLTFGRDDGATCRVIAEGSRCFGLAFRGQTMGTIRLQVPGEHNHLNAAAAAAVALELGFSFAEVREGLEGFEGVQRRLEFVGAAQGIAIYDDYGHHPTEIAVTLRTLRQHVPGRLVVAFQPHLYSRTRDFLLQFAQVLAHGCDALVLVEIYPAREQPIPGISSMRLAEEVRRLRPDMPLRCVETPYQAVEALLEVAQPGDTVLTLGAGELDQTARLLLQRLEGDTSG